MSHFIRRSLNVSAASEKARSGANQAPCEPSHIRHARAWLRATDRICAEISRQTGVRVDTLRAWARPHNEERPSPTEKAERVMRAARDGGMDEADAIAPLEALADAMGYVLERKEVGAPLSLVAAASHVVAESGDVLRSVATAMADSRATPAEREDLRRQARELMNALTEFEEAIEVSNNSEGPGAGTLRALRKENVTP